VRLRGAQVGNAQRAVTAASRDVALHLRTWAESARATAAASR
jgi:hypothetical protein